MDKKQYDCTVDVLRHKIFVAEHIVTVCKILLERAIEHDNSKLAEPEKSCFDKWEPRENGVKFGSPEYNAVLGDISQCLDMHYEENKHHPEHYPGGVNDMTIVDITEMLCDWLAASRDHNREIDLHYLFSRFGIDKQLGDIITNTVISIKATE